MNLVFSASPLRSATAFHRLVETDEPHLLLSARFERWDKRVSLGDESWVQKYLHGRWSLWLYPVRRQKRSMASILLVETALPQVARWFASARAPSWYWGRKRCDVTFLPVTGEVRLEEVVDAP